MCPGFFRISSQRPRLQASFWKLAVPDSAWEGDPVSICGVAKNRWQPISTLLAHLGLEWVKGPGRISEMAFRTPLTPLLPATLSRLLRTMTPLCAPLFLLSLWSSSVTPPSPLKGLPSVRSALRRAIPAPVCASIDQSRQVVGCEVSAAFKGQGGCPGEGNLSPQPSLQSPGLCRLLHPLWPVS